jgi:BTB/POZ domain
MAVKVSGSAFDDETSTGRASIRSRNPSYNPKQWRTSGSYRVDGVIKTAALHNPIEEHLFQRGYVLGICADISVCAFAKEYALHRIILDRSPFFSSMFAGPWRDADSPVVNLNFSDPNITKEAFEAAVQRLYGRIVVPEDNMLESLLATAAYLDLQDLVQECLATLVRTVNVDNVAKRYAFARGKQYYGETSDTLAGACITILNHAGSSMSLEQWDNIPIDVCASVLSSDSFWVEGEYERYCFARDLIRRRKAQGEEDLQPLEHVLVYGIYYLHLPFDLLRKILTENEGVDAVLPPNTIHSALWQQTELRRIIQSSDSNLPSLGLTSQDGFCIPMKDTMLDPFTTDDDGTMYPEKTGNDDVCPAQFPEQPVVGSASPFPPCRFSYEFRNIRSLTENEKTYSRSVFYAGSSWRVLPVPTHLILVIPPEETHQASVSRVLPPTS